MVLREKMAYAGGIQAGGTGIPLCTRRSHETAPLAQGPFGCRRTGCRDDDESAGAG